MSKWVVTEPGIYDMPAEDYHADPVPDGSLSSTGARTLVKRCPASYDFDQHKPEDQKKKHFVLGSAAHLMVLEPEKFAEKIHVVDADDWRTKAAKEERDQATADGKTALLNKDLLALKSMRDVIWKDAVICRAFEDSVYEKSLFWRDAETGIMCRCRPDVLPLSAPYMADYKTTTDASPDAFARSIYDHGYHQQAAWYLEGFERLYNRSLDNFWFIAQETSAPYLTSIHRVSPYGLQIGRALNQRAKRIWKHCKETGQWPGFLPDFSGKQIFFQAEPPPWVAKTYEQQLEEDYFTRIPGITEDV